MTGREIALLTIFMAVLGWKFSLKFLSDFEHVRDSYKGWGNSCYEDAELTRLKATLETMKNGGNKNG